MQELDKAKLDAWIQRDQDTGTEGEDEFVVKYAMLETYTARGNLVSQRTDPIEEWDRLMVVDANGVFLLASITFTYVDGSTYIVTRHEP